MKNMKIIANLVLVTSLGLMAAGCSSGSLLPSQTSLNSQTQAGAMPSGASSTDQLAFSRFPDLPIPSHATMDNQRTIVFGSGESWYGQLALNTTNTADVMFDFYRQQLSGYDWREITSVRAPVSVLTYERGSRILSIQISAASLGGAQITLTISPRGTDLPG